MGEAIKTSGRFYWHELMASDVERAKGFYGELFGWTAKSMDMGPKGTYWVLSAGDKQVAGLMKAESREKSGWLSYVTAVDVDATVATAKAAGATIAVPPSDIPGIGRFAILVDREGAKLAPFRPLEESAEPIGTPGLGEFCWAELITQNPESAVKLYTQTFGYTTEQKDMGPVGIYTIFKRGDLQAGGCMKAMSPKGPSHWLDYVVVDDVDANFVRAQKLGAKVAVPPMDIPGIGRAAVVLDAEDAPIALFKA